MEQSALHEEGAIVPRAGTMEIENRGPCPTSAYSKMPREVAARRFSMGAVYQSLSQGIELIRTIRSA
jgi:hypothetical protein